MVQINLTVILKGLYALCGLMVLLCGLIHLCKWGWKGWHIKGLQSNGSVVCGFVALLLMINGIYMIISPFIVFIPSVGKFGGSFWNLHTSIAWLIVTGSLVPVQI